MSIPSNPIPPEDEPNEPNIDGEPVFPDAADDEVIPISYETNIAGRDVPPLEDPVGETAQLEAADDQLVVDAAYTDLDEPGEITETPPISTPMRPAYIAILSILGLVILCCIMAGVMFLLLRNEIFTAGI